MITGLILIFSSILSYIENVYLYIKQPYNSFYVFIFWIISILSLLLYVAYKERAKINQVFNLKNLSFVKLLNTNTLIIIIMILATVVRFWNITSIPILTHDEAKDAGLFPQKIISGELKDYFGFYAGINNIFFVLSAIPHLFLTNPILKVRFFSALFGIFSVLLIYILVKKIYGKRAGLIAALFLSVYHIHIHFSRTEFLNLFDSFYALVILIAFSILSNSWKINNIILLATILGIGLHFYSGLRAIILLTTTTFIVITFAKFNLKKFIIFAITFLIIFLIALGPTTVVMKTRQEEAKALGTSTFVFSPNKNLNSIIKQIAVNYRDSLLAYIKTPIDFHYNYGGSFLVVPFSIFFLLGFIFALRKIKEPIHFLIILSIIGIPFFNSAIFNQINYTHRLFSIIPLIVFVTSLGVEKCALFIKKITNRKVAMIFIIIVCSYFVIYNLHLYFYKNIWEKTLNINEFRAWEVQKLVNQEDSKNTITFFIGINYFPSYRSVPSLEYLTQKHKIIDIAYQEMLYQIPNYRNFSNYLFIILPGNNIIPDQQILTKYLSPNRISSKRIYYKDMYLFDFLKMTK